METIPERREVGDYDAEPVRYCSRCYSLKVKYEEDIDSEYCADCGCSDILESSFEEWEQKYEKRYGHKFAVKTNDPQKSFLFNLPLEKIKTKIYNSEKWRDIIKSLYPRFPGGLSKADSIILFFDTIIKDNKINDLKYTLLKIFKN